ncbi:unnamed protein product [Lampetra fluviatilis]
MGEGLGDDVTGGGRARQPPRPGRAVERQAGQSSAERRASGARQAGQWSAERRVSGACQAWQVERRQRLEQQQ